MPRSSLERKLDALRARQHQAFTRRQLIDLGFSRGAIEARVESGAWQTPRRATYVVSGTADTWEQRAMVLALAAGAHAAISHFGAAYLWKLIEAKPERIDVTVPSHRRAAGARRASNFSDRDIRRISGIPVTCVPRTLVDLAAVLDDHRLQAAFDTAVVRGLATPKSVARYIADRGLANLVGLGRLKAIVADRAAFGVPETEIERRLERLLEGAGLLRPTRQLRDDGRRIDYVYLYDEQRIAIELDGWGSHGTKAAFQSDRRRQNRLVLEGYLPLRFTWDDVTLRGTEVIETVRRALER